MLIQMSDPHEVSIDSLIKISEGLIGSFFFSPDIYALLVLALVTVTTYSRKKHRLTAQTRIELSIAFLPDLIQSLIKKNIIAQNVGKELTRQCDTRRNELPLILRAYMYVVRGLPIKAETPEIKKKECIIL